MAAGLMRKIRNSLHTTPVARSDPRSIPPHKLKPLINDTIIAQLSLPESTSCSLKHSLSDSSLPSPELGWDESIPEADGDAVTLYDAVALDKEKHHGDPIADVFAIVARPSSAILALADGCNWGQKPLKAARCAVKGCIEFLNKALFDDETMPRDTQALGNAHPVAVTCEMEAPIHNKSWALCVVSVGDSPCLVWKHKREVVEEVTSVVEEGKERDLRDCGGCLGANVGTQPDLSNLMCYFVPVARNDVVFLTSDGVFDNFDPVILLQGTTECERQKKSGENVAILGDLPVLSRRQREEGQLQMIAELLRKIKSENSDQMLDARTITSGLIDYVKGVTNGKRSYLESGCADVDSSNLSAHAKSKKKAEMLSTLPGKLDHASIVAYKIGGPLLDGDAQQESDLSTTSVALNHNTEEIDGFLSVNLGHSSKAS
ncbi:hypothetical protein EMCRGX_G019707 [Ephydatia muelleri]